MKVKRYARNSPEAQNVMAGMTAVLVDGMGRKITRIPRDPAFYLRGWVYPQQKEMKDELAMLAAMNAAQTQIAAARQPATSGIAAVAPPNATPVVSRSDVIPPTATPVASGRVIASIPSAAEVFGPSAPASPCGTA